jgi:hypothetical protein
VYVLSRTYTALATPEFNALLEDFKKGKKVQGLNRRSYEGLGRARWGWEGLDQGPLGL